MRKRSPDGVPNQGIEHLENAVQRMQQADTNSLCTVLSRMPYIHRMRILLLQSWWRHKPIMGRLRTRKHRPLPRRCEQQRIRPCEQQRIRPCKRQRLRPQWLELPRLSEGIALHTSKFRKCLRKCTMQKGSACGDTARFHFN